MTFGCRNAREIPMSDPSADASRATGNAAGPKRLVASRLALTFISQVIVRTTSARTGGGLEVCPAGAKRAEDSAGAGTSGRVGTSGTTGSASSRLPFTSCSHRPA
jgi:hypothetical protein